MTQDRTIHSKWSLIAEFTGFVVLAVILKAALDPYIWRYSGPVSLVILLTIIFGYMRLRGQNLSSIGLLRLSSRKNYKLLLPQILLVFLGIGASGMAVGVGGEALGLEFMKPDSTGAQNRFGDLAGNTPLYLSWLAILWIAGPAEELFFRGFLISKLRQIFGDTRIAAAASVIVPALIFGFGHMYYQGLRGVVLTGAIGLTLGILFLLFKRNLWPLMIAHALVNTLSFTAMYLQWDP